MGQTATNIKRLFESKLNLLKPLEPLKQAIEKNDEAIMDLNRQQLDRGQDAKGKSLGRYKSFNYKGRFQPVDLKLTGEFRRKFTLAVDDKKTIIFSQDQKEPQLEKKYGKDIFGVQTPLLANVGQLIQDDFFEGVKKQIGK